MNTTVLQEGRMSLRCVAMDASKRRANVSWRGGADEPLSNRYAVHYHTGAPQGFGSLRAVHLEAVL